MTSSNNTEFGIYSSVKFYQWKFRVFGVFWKLTKLTEPGQARGKKFRPEAPDVRAGFFEPIFRAGLKDSITNILSIFPHMRKNPLRYNFPKLQILTYVTHFSLKGPLFLIKGYLELQTLVTHA